MKFLMLAGLVAASLLLATPSLACSIVGDIATSGNLTQRAPIVLTATTVAVENSLFGSRNATFAVECIYKTPQGFDRTPIAPGSLIQVQGYGDGSLCRQTPRVGNKYILYLNETLHAIDGTYSQLRDATNQNACGPSGVFANLDSDSISLGQCMLDTYCSDVGSQACSEADARKCHSTAYCEDFGWGGVCLCPEGSVGDGVSKEYDGSECSRESWSVRVSLDLGSPVVTASGHRLDFWEETRSIFTDLFFAQPWNQKPSWLDTSVHHFVTARRYVTIAVLFETEAQADAALVQFQNNVDLDPPAWAFGVDLVSSALTAEPRVYTFVSRTSEAELRILPTGMDVQNVYFQHDCMASGCWVIDLIYTTGEDNFNVFYLPKAVGNDTLSYDFDYTAIPSYATPYGKSPADTFLPLNFPCGSDGYQSKPGPHIPNQVSACCIEEFTELYRPVDTFVTDDKITEVIGASREGFCAGPELCAAEGGVCDCVGRVQYGADGKFFYKESDGSLPCTNEEFGDPSENTLKNCFCSPRRKVWSKYDMPESALFGNFSGMDGLARVDFKSVEDPFVRQFTATVRLDEVALRRRAGILSGAVGVAHAIDTFIGFANFKPTGLEFLDMFAAQTNVHLEKTNFFTVSAYGENEYTFLEYVNLRLVAIYKEDDGAALNEPFTFDSYHLRTGFQAYPPSAATGSTTLGSDSQVWITEEADGSYRVHYHLTGLAAGETQGGIHVHEGTSCETHEQVLGHYFSTPPDPWTTVWSKEAGSTVATGSVSVANPGFGLEKNDKHAFVVHEQSGSRIACGVLYDVQADLSRTSPQQAAQYLQVTFTLGEQYQPIETGIIPLDSVLVSKGQFITTAETVDTRFHACQQYVDGTFPEQARFNSRFPTQTSQTCAPNATMCYNPPHIPDQFVSFNVPLGIDWLPAPSNNLDSNVFVDMVVSVIDAHQIAMPGGIPNNGDPAEQMKTTLTASIPVVEGGLYIFCDRITVREDLLDVANADLILGSAGYDHEFSRLRILKDIASGPFDVLRNDTYFKTDSIEAGLMTLVIKGNESYFARATGYSLEVEDVITIHVMEPETGTKYDQLLALLATPGQDASATTEGFALNGAFVFTVDRAQDRASLSPTDELNQLCPFSPQRPNPDDAFPETCVSRRDIASRGFPALSGKNATAIELPSADVALDDPQREGVARFMQLVLNPSLYAAELGRNFSHIVGQKYNLNGRYNRAFWINPGYEWSPQQTGNQDIFTLSQKIVMFALINLDEGFAGRRRMLLQSANPTDNTGAGVSGQQVTFDTSPQSMMANLFHIPEELVATFSVEVQLTQQEACLSQSELRQSVRSTLDGYIGETTTHYETVQVLSMAVNQADVQCNSRRSLPRKLLSYSAATATVEMMVVFSPSDYVAINLQKFANMAGINSISPLHKSNLIQITNDEQVVPTETYKPVAPVPNPDTVAPAEPAAPASTPAEVAAASSGPDLTMIAIIVGVTVVVIGIGFFAYTKYQNKEREVQVIDTLKIEDVRAELALP